MDPEQLRASIIKSASQMTQEELHLLCEYIRSLKRKKNEPLPEWIVESLTTV